MEKVVYRIEVSHTNPAMMDKFNVCLAAGENILDGFQKYGKFDKKWFDSHYIENFERSCFCCQCYAEDDDSHESHCDMKDDKDNLKEKFTSRILNSGGYNDPKCIHSEKSTEKTSCIIVQEESEYWNVIAYDLWFGKRYSNIPEVGTRGSRIESTNVLPPTQGFANLESLDFKVTVVGQHINDERNDSTSFYWTEGKFKTFDHECEEVPELIEESLKQLASCEIPAITEMFGPVLHGVVANRIAYSK